jgi:two-component system, NtrC family, sensor kinase
MATILFVDDEDSLRRATRAALGRRGHTVHTAHSVAEAIRCLGLYHIDGIFVDVWLGADSGFDLLSWLENHRPHLAQRVVFVTGDVGLVGHEDRKVKALGLPVLGKPFSIEDLESYADSWTRRQEHGDDLHTTS